MFGKFGAKIVDTTTGQIPAGALVAGPNLELQKGISYHLNSHNALVR